MIPLFLALVMGGGVPPLSSCAVYEAQVGQNHDAVRIYTAETDTVSPETLPKELRDWWEGYSHRVSDQSFSNNAVVEKALVRELLNTVPPSALIMVRRWLFERQDGRRGALTTVVLPSGATVTRIRDLETGATLVVGVQLGHGDVGQLIQAALKAPDPKARSEAMARVRREASQGELVCQVGSERRYLPANQGADVGATLLELGRLLPRQQWQALSWWLAFLTRLTESDCLRPKGELPSLKLAFDPRRVDIDADVAAIPACTVQVSSPPSLNNGCDDVLRQQFGSRSLRPLKLHADFAAMFRELAP